MQPYLFPYIGYFQLINSVDKFVFYDDVSFIKQGWINRNNILLDGKKYMFSLPVKNISSFCTINNTIVSDLPFKWNFKLISTIQQSYKKAPYFNMAFPQIENILKDSIGRPISDVSKDSIKMVLDYLGLNKVIIETSAIYNNNHLKSEERVIDICIKENASEYINPIGGSDLYFEKNFKRNNINLKFLKSNEIIYHQLNQEFVHSLSIIDIIMFNDVEMINNELLSAFSLSSNSYD